MIVNNQSQKYFFLLLVFRYIRIIYIKANLIILSNIHYLLNLIK